MGAEALFQNDFEMLKLESVQLQPQREVTRRSKHSWLSSLLITIQ